MPRCMPVMARTAANDAQTAADDAAEATMVTDAVLAQEESSRDALDSAEDFTETM